VTAAGRCCCGWKEALSRVHGRTCRWQVSQSCSRGPRDCPRSPEIARDRPRVPERTREDLQVAGQPELLELLHVEQVLDLISGNLGLISGNLELLHAAQVVDRAHKRQRRRCPHLDATAGYSRAISGHLRDAAPPPTLTQPGRMSHGACARSHKQSQRGMMSSRPSTTPPEDRIQCGFRFRGRCGTERASDGHRVAEA